MAHGELQVLGNWDAYLARMVQEGRAEFANPQDFAARYGVHSNGSGPEKEKLPGNYARDEDFEPGGIYYRPSADG